MTKWNYALLVSLLSIFACGNGQFETEMSMLDSAEAQLTAAGKMLQIDAESIEKREKEMEEKKLYFREHYADSPSLELVQLVESYIGIATIYENYLRNHSSLEKEHEELEKQLRDLRHSLKKEEITRKDFHIYFSKEKKDIEELLEHTEETARRVFEVEPIFKRLSPQMDSILVKLGKQ